MHSSYCVWNWHVLYELIIDYNVWIAIDWDLIVVIIYYQNIV